MEDCSLSPESTHWTAVSSKVDVAFKAVPAGADPLVVWVIADELLEAETEYELSVGDTKPAPFSVAFRTGTDVDESPPEAKAPKVEPVSASGACGEANSARIFWGGIQDNGDAMPYEPIVKARVNNGEREVEMFLDAKNLVPGRGLVLVNPLDQGSAECWRHFALPFEDETALRSSIAPATVSSSNQST